MKTQPDLGITNPYALDQEQFDAAVDLLKTQKGIIGEYWSDYTKYEEAATQGSTVLGTTWQVIVNALQAADPPVPVEAMQPKEGATGWSDTWMISSQGQAPELHVPVDGLHHLARGQRRGRRVLRRGAGQPKSCAHHDRPEPLRARSTPRTRPTATSVCVLDHADQGRASTAAATSACRTPSGSRPGTRSRADRTVRP